MTEPSARDTEMRSLLADTTARALRYLDETNIRPVGPRPEALARLRDFDTPLPEGSTDPATVIAELDSHSDASVVMNGPRYFGFVTGASLPATLAAGWLATAWDQNAALSAMSPLAARIESVASGWVVDLLRLPAGTGTGFVTGATMANFSCLLAARHALLARAGWDVEAEGLFGAPPITVVVGDEVHASMVKALGMAGFGRTRAVRVPTDDQGRMRADAFANILPTLSGPILVCLQAGNVNTGAFDPAPEIIPVAKAAGAWVHVDGAFGLWAAASPHYAHLMAGYADADSWATDAHKYLNTPYDSGFAFVRDPETLRAAMTVGAAYLPAEATREPMEYTPEMSRRGRGIEVWAALRSLGRAGVAELVDRTCRHARRFAEGLRAAGYEVLNDVVLNQVLVSFGSPENTQRVIKGIQEDGTCWMGSTVWQGKTAMRISVSSWRTTDEDVERSLEAITRVARAVVQ